MIAKKIAENLKSGSWIRRMFEEGARLKARFGPDAVFDFSLGNPDLEPPREVVEALEAVVASRTPGMHRYMANAGYESARSAVARKLSAQSGVEVPASCVVMTVGAAGALNVAFKTLLDPGDEVVVLAPYFVEYLSYIDNHGGRAVVVDCSRETFLPDVPAIAAALTPRTKALLLNSPNNPSGAVYPEALLRSLATALDEAERRFGTSICVVSDEPYSEIVFDGTTVPATFSVFRNAVVASSWSKSLALPGERIGYVAVHPGAEDAEAIAAALVYANRTLGFVNAPALFQAVVARAIDARVDIASYTARRDRLHAVLTGAGFTCRMPQGALYLFARSPEPDDVAFAARAAAQNVLVVPGTGFGFPGFFRLTYCVDMKTIENSAAAWRSIAAGYGLAPAGTGPVPS
jgi:aspartate aminotransferase